MTHIHLIGIGGTGISSIARVLLEKGYTVSGSDRSLSPLALELQKAGVTIYEGHAPEHIKGADMVVRSSAISDDNVEVMEARKLNIPVLKRSDFLGSLMEKNIGIAVAGSHGKTTTSALMAWSLYRLGLDPSYILGGVSKNLGINAHAGSGDYFVVEADEYDRMFLGLNPGAILITNVEYDHPDCYPTPADYALAFKEFIHRLKPNGVILADYESTVKHGLFQSLPVASTGFTFGLNPMADYYALNLKQNQIGGYTFDVVFSPDALPITTVSLQIPGEHNVRNALGVIGLHHQLGTNVHVAAQSLAEFMGTGRRFDVVGEVNGITIVDDYAHHPTKITATLSAARVRYPGRRLVAVWQPHTYSRTRSLAKEFIHSLEGADLVIVSEIFASREKAEDYSSKELVQQMDLRKALYIASIPEITRYLTRHLIPGDVLIVLSAGDADQICKSVYSNLSERKA
jgi:UDP-N-acetylmuramate--alanine ligase